MIPIFDEIKNMKPQPGSNAYFDEVDVGNIINNSHYHDYNDNDDDYHDNWDDDDVKENDDDDSQDPEWTSAVDDRSSSRKTKKNASTPPKVSVLEDRVSAIQLPVPTAADDEGHIDLFVTEFAKAVLGIERLHICDIRWIHEYLSKHEVLKHAFWKNGIFTTPRVNTDVGEKKANSTYHDERISYQSALLQKNIQWEEKDFTCKSSEGAIANAIRGLTNTTQGASRPMPCNKISWIMTMLDKILPLVCRKDQDTTLRIFFDLGYGTAAPLYWAVHEGPFEEAFGIEIDNITVQQSVNNWREFVDESVQAEKGVPMISLAKGDLFDVKNLCGADILFANVRGCTFKPGSELNKRECAYYAISDIANRNPETKVLIIGCPSYSNSNSPYTPHFVDYYRWEHHSPVCHLVPNETSGIWFVVFVKKTMLYQQSAEKEDLVEWRNRSEKFGKYGSLREYLLDEEEMNGNQKQKSDDLSCPAVRAYAFLQELKSLKNDNDGKMKAVKKRQDELETEAASELKCPRNAAS
jgi:hypothetical protein